MAIKKEVILDINSAKASASLTDLRNKILLLQGGLPLLEGSLKNVEDVLMKMGASGKTVLERINELNNGLDDTGLGVMNVNKILRENQEFFKFLAEQPLGTSISDAKKEFFKLRDELSLVQDNLSGVTDEVLRLGDADLERLAKKFGTLSWQIASLVDSGKSLDEASEIVLGRLPQPADLTLLEEALREYEEMLNEVKVTSALFGKELANVSDTMTSGLSAATAASVLLTRENQFLMTGLTDLSDPLVRLQGKEGFGGFSSSVTEFVNDMKNAWTATSVFNETVGADLAQSWSNQLKTVRRNNVAIREEYEASLSDEEKRTRALKKQLVQRIAVYEKSAKEQETLEEENDLRQTLRDETEKLSYEKKLQYVADYYAAILEIHAAQMTEMDERLAQVDEKDKEKQEELEAEKEELKENQREENEMFKEEYLLFLYELLEEEELIGLERLNVEKKIQTALTSTLKLGAKEREETQEETQKKQKKSMMAFLAKMETITKVTIKDYIGNMDKYVENTRQLFDETNKMLEANTVAGQGYAVADATIKAYQGASNAFATAPFPASYVAAFNALRDGFKNVRAIVKVDPKGENSVPTPSGNSSSQSNIGSITEEPVTPQDKLIPQAEVQLLGQESQIEQVVNLLNSSEDQSLNNSSKVYVVETDISETINKVSVKEAEATY